MLMSDDCICFVLVLVVGYPGIFLANVCQSGLALLGQPTARLCVCVSTDKRYVVFRMCLGTTHFRLQPGFLRRCYRRKITFRTFQAKRDKNVVII
jgi:hypothetical protein